jgi:hypothetical protein
MRFRHKLRGETLTLLDPLERNDLIHWTADEVKKPNNPECYTPSPEPLKSIQKCSLKLKNYENETSLNSSVGALGWTNAESCFDCRQGQEILLSSTVSLSVLVSNHICNRYRVLFHLGYNSWGVMLATVLTLRMHGATPSLSYRGVVLV